MFASQLSIVQLERDTVGNYSSYQSYSPVRLLTLLVSTEFVYNTVYIISPAVGKEPLAQNLPEASF